MDILIANLIISSLTLICSFIDKLKCRHVEGCCFVSDCMRPNSNSSTPNVEREILLK